MSGRVPDDKDHLTNGHLESRLGELPPGVRRGVRRLSRAEICELGDVVKRAIRRAEESGRIVGSIDREATDA
jgi:hypothetical protein